MAGRIDRAPEVHWADEVSFAIVGEIAYCSIKSCGRTIVYEGTVAAAQRGAASWATVIARHNARDGASIIRFPGAKPTPAH